MVTDQQVLLLRRRIMEGKDTTGISGSGGYERKGRSQVAEWSVAVGEEEAQLANAPGRVLGGVGRGDSAAAAQGRKREVAGDSAA